MSQALSHCQQHCATQPPSTPSPTPWQELEVQLGLAASPGAWNPASCCCNLKAQVCATIGISPVVCSADNASFMLAASCRSGCLLASPFLGFFPCIFTDWPQRLFAWAHFAFLRFACYALSFPTQVRVTACSLDWGTVCNNYTSSSHQPYRPHAAFIVVFFQPARQEACLQLTVYNRVDVSQANGQMLQRPSGR